MGRKGKRSEGSKMVRRPWSSDSCRHVETESIMEMLNVSVGQLVVDKMMAAGLRPASYSDTGMCSTDEPYTVKNSNKRRCAVECLQLATCEDFNHKNDSNECALFFHKPLFYESIPGCTGYKASYDCI